jgi:hypothetical protein
MFWLIIHILDILHLTNNKNKNNNNNNNNNNTNNNKEVISGHELSNSSIVKKEATVIPIHVLSNLSITAGITTIKEEVVHTRPLKESREGRQDVQHVVKHPFWQASGERVQHNY